MKEWIYVALVTCSCISTGCSFLAPGLDTRMAAKADSATTWSEDQFQINESTTHNRKVFMIESPEGTATGSFDPSGGVMTFENASAAMYQQSEPHDVMQAYMALAVENAKVAGQMMELIDKIANTYVPGAGGGIEVSGSVGGELTVPSLGGVISGSIGSAQPNGDPE